MRFLFTAARNQIYDARVVEQLAIPLADARHFCLIIGPLERTPENVKGFDVAIEVNMARPEFLPKTCRHVAWVQDVLPQGEPEYAARARDGDLVYCLGDPDVLRMKNAGKFYAGQLFTGAEVLSPPIALPTIDFSIAGYIPEPFPKEWLENPAQMELLNAVQANFMPFAGELNIERLESAVRDKFIEFAGDRFWGSNKDSFKFLCREFPRMIERVALVEMVIRISDNCEFCGLNWECWPQYAKWVKPHIETEQGLLALYQRSKINLHHNIHGVGMHSRVLEAMGAGGFVMSHDSTNLARLSAYFEPDVHFGLFDANNFAEKARYWLENNELRNKAIVSARKVIADKHLWRHRTIQVLNDLGLDLLHLSA